MDTRRIVYIEDGDWRSRLAPAYRKGFARDGILFEDREDFVLLRDEITSGNLADVYILDNEIAGDADEGGQMAQKIHDKAQEVRKEVLVITMLCSNPSGVRKIYGDELDKRGIPILNKSYHAPFCGFYIGRCLDKGRVYFDDWLKQEGITLPQSNFDSLEVESAILGELEDGEPGSLYISPRDYINRNRETVIRFLKPEAVRELNRMIPQKGGREIRLN